MMNCESTERLLPRYTLGSLGWSEAARFTEHVEACARCAEKTRAAGDTLVNLSSIVPRRDPPARVKAGLLARVARARGERSAPSAPSPAPVASGIFRVFPLGAVVASVLVIGALAVLAGVYWRGQDARDAALGGESVARQELYLFDAFPDDPGVTIKRLSANASSVPPETGESLPSAVIIISAKENAAVIAARNMPQLPPNQVYAVRLIKRGGLEIRAATFTVGADGLGQAEIALGAPLEEFRAALITIDNVADDPTSRRGNALSVDL